MMVEGIKCGGRDDADLAHSTAEKLAQPPRAADRVARAGQRRADRRSEPLGKADRDRVEVLTPLVCRSARRHHGVHEPGAVEVHGQVVLASPPGDLGDRCRSGARGRRRGCECFPDRSAAFARSGRRRWAGSPRADRRATRCLDHPRRSARSRSKAWRSPRPPTRRRATSCCRAARRRARCSRRRRSGWPSCPTARTRPPPCPGARLSGPRAVLTVGSSPKTSSPTSASAIARRIAGVGLVTVSERRSIGGRCIFLLLSKATGMNAIELHTTLSILDPPSGDCQCDTSRRRLPASRTTEHARTDGLSFARGMCHRPRVRGPARGHRRRGRSVSGSRRHPAARLSGGRPGSVVSASSRDGVSACSATCSARSTAPDISFAMRSSRCAD